MARELVLVPKSKYEHLLKLAKNAEQTEQSGGQVGNTEGNTPNPGIGSKDNISDEKFNTSESKKELEKNTKEEEGEKPRLYIDKPLSEMPFGKTKFIASRGKMVAREKRTSLKEKKLESLNGTKKGAKSRWINYII